MIATREEFEAQIAQLRAAVPELDDRMAVRSWRCSTCVQCQEAYGMVPIFDPAFNRDRDGGYHYQLLFDGTEPVFGGKVASGFGRTDQEAWDNLLRALA